MILEVAILDVKPSMVNEFETAFQTASTIIASMPG
ncbi:antibiotic biosynthesis monooxygenase family protein, partial [Allocoleopsis sp.]